MQRRTVTARPRRRTASGLPVEGAIRPHAPRVLPRKHTRAWLTLSLTLLALILVTVLLNLQRSSFFKVAHVDVSGTSRLDRTTVIADAAVLGQQIYRVNTETAQAALLRLPVIEAVRVRRVWPNRVSITVQERRPWGTWQIGGVNYLIADDGTVLDIVTTPQLVTIFERDAAPGLRPGEQVDADAVRTARLLVDQLPQTVAQRVARLEYSTEDGLTLVTDAGVEVRLGDGQNLQYKLAVWQALDTKVGAQNVHLLDLRSVDRPYYR